MRKPRKSHSWIAHRIDPDDSQNLGDFRIVHRVQGEPRGLYQYASDEYVGRGEPWRRRTVVNRRTLRRISMGTRTYTECIKAVERLLREEA